MNRTNISITAALALLLMGCGGAVDQTSEPPQADTSHESTPIDEVVSVYDALRSQLANEEMEGLAAAFTRLRSAALDASNETVSDVVKDHLQQMRDAAARGAEVGDADLEGVRTAFGEASEHLVAAIASDPSLAHGLYVFECPMTQGYPKWVQKSDSKANPYMGKDLQSCGVKSEWSE